MPGKGRYTLYVIGDPAKRTFLNSMFKGDAKREPPFINVTTQEGAVEEANARGNEFLHPAVQTGDLQMFDKTGGTVNLKYGDSPDTTKPEKWEPGNPANPYVPDLRSPGPEAGANVNYGASEPGTELSVEALNPGYVLTDNTKSPAAAAKTVFKKLGDTLNSGKV